MADIHRNADLGGLNTLALPVHADYYLKAVTLADLQQGLDFARQQQLPLWLLGGGSNTLFAAHFPGLVLHVANRGIDVLSEDDERVRLAVAGGENWDDFLQYCLRHHYYGLENLAIIPGTVGAAPIQNIGAYGQEVADCIDAVEVIETASGRLLQLAAQDCRFAYRDSLFKQQPGRYLVVAVHFLLHKQFVANLTYRPLADALAGQPLTAGAVRNAVIGLRNARLPDPARLANCGSFFKNPLVDAGTWAAICQYDVTAPGFIQPDGRVKIPAAWLIEQCGWRGKRLGPVGMYDQQALVLVNHGGASHADVMALAAAIRADVQQRFAVTLEPEPVQAHGG